MLNRLPKFFTVYSSSFWLKLFLRFCLNYKPLNTPELSNYSQDQPVQITIAVEFVSWYECALGRTSVSSHMVFATAQD